MSRRLLIPLVMFALACMGAECSGSSSSSSGNAAQTSSFAGADDGRDGVGAAPIPEPGAALVFGAGLLVAGVALRRSRRS